MEYCGTICKYVNIIVYRLNVDFYVFMECPCATCGSFSRWLTYKKTVICTLFDRIRNLRIDKFLRKISKTDEND